MNTQRNKIDMYKISRARHLISKAYQLLRETECLNYKLEGDFNSIRNTCDQIIEEHRPEENVCNQVI